MNTGNAIPTRQEKEDQLARILGSQTFEKYRKLRELLERLVKDCLDGKPVNEDMLGRDLFGKPANWVPMEETVVREGMRNLRSRLKQYYCAEGYGDAVLISFPKRSGYAPRFSFNPVSNAEESVRRFESDFSHTFPDVMRCGNIIAELEAWIGKHPSYAPAYALLAQSILSCVMCDEASAFPMPEALLRVEAAVKAGLELHGELWRLHVAAGAVHCCRFAWDKADAAFETALRLAPDDTRAHFWYAAFLLAVGRTEEAKQCVTFREKTSPKARFTSYLRPVFLYLLREHKAAYDNLTLQSPYFFDIASRFDYLSGDEIVPFDDWPVEILMACLCLALNQGKPGRRYAEAGVQHSKVGAFNGLVVLTRVEAGKIYKDATDDALSFLARLEAETQWQSPVSLALAYMGVGRTDEAIAKLKEACDIGHPLMVWLHLWPVFDPVRGHRRFKTLVKKMNLPA
jgi:tetratricopeptide (TPR) repeat protein